ncbi:5'-3' exonuclease [Bermanella sp. WJH001]|uniref:5'-3' exonuclease n=1 Tax=Bermanella sp. WJH001 TaxID=3048005 RepID=UPI0024BD76F8|nr:5'-3' exonuclease H3TH domain-containing protein [Bermanella sp. WJH001]MDJ1537548.1 5'-3' exonuclease H3TH domain-containing protein [Bermanella sp. WJH001]
MKHAHLIDISAVFFRYYFAPGPTVINEDGWEVYPLLASLRWLMNPDFFDADLTVAAFDESLGTCFRHQLDPQYKANRALPTEDIIYQLSLLKSFCEHMGFVVQAGAEFEADDYIAASVSQLSDYQITIHSRDKDLRQLLAENVIMRDSATDALWDESRLLSDTGLCANQVVDYLSMVGDASDNIEGIPGIGVKTATTLLQHYTDAQGIYQAIGAEEVLPVRGAKRIATALLENKPRLLLNQTLTRLRQDIPLNLAPLPFNQDNYVFIDALTQQVGIHRPLKKALETLAGLYL